MARAEHMERACATLSSVGRSVGRSGGGARHEGGRRRCGPIEKGRRRRATRGCVYVRVGKTRTRLVGWSVGRYWRSRASRKSRWRKPRGSESESRRYLHDGRWRAGRGRVVRWRGGMRRGMSGMNGGERAWWRWWWNGRCGTRHREEEAAEQPEAAPEAPESECCCAVREQKRAEESKRTVAHWGLCSLPAIASYPCPAKPPNRQSGKPLAIRLFVASSSSSCAARLLACSCDGDRTRRDPRWRRGRYR